MLLGALLCSALPLVAAPPPVPEILSIEDPLGGTASVASALITWRSVANPDGGTTHYKIYRGDPSPVLLATITDGATSYTDAAPPDPNVTDPLIDARHGTCAYRVSAVNPVPNPMEESALSAPGYYGFRRTPLVLAWNDDHHSPATDFRAASWPGGATEPPRVTIGDDGVALQANGQPIRFLGVNVAFGGCLPAKADAPKIAARMAQFGINLVRLHNFDDKPGDPFVETKSGGDVQHSGHEGILKNPSAAFAGASEVNLEELDKLDFFIGELRKNFIYVDLNLRVGKDYPTPAGGAAARYKGIDLYYPDYIAEQEAFASFLLNHENPYAPKAGGGHHTYKSDPAIAMVEINNEDGLIASWWGSALDGTLDPAHRAALTTRWNDWLTTKYGTTAALAAAWQPRTVGTDFPTGTELLAEGGLANGFVTPWQLQVVAPAAVGGNPPTVLATGGPTGGPALRVTVTSADTTKWHVQVLYNNVTLDPTKPHTLRFHARVSEQTARTIRVGWRNHGNYQVLHDTELELSDTWREFIVLLPASADNDGPVDVFFSDLAQRTGEMLLAGVSLKVGNEVVGGTSFLVESADTGAELVNNGLFPNTTSIATNGGWTVNDTDPRISPTVVSSSVVAAGGDGGGAGNNAAAIQISGANEASGVYLRRTGVAYTAGRTYALTFHAKHSSSNTSKITASGRNLTNVFRSGSYALSTSWQTFTLVYTASLTTSNGYVDFSLGSVASGTVSISQVSVTEIPATGLGAETLGAVSFPRCLDFHRRSRAQQNDWLEFLWDTEVGYWKHMRDHIVGLTGVEDRPLIIGTQVDYSPAFVQAQDMDIIDTHSYWQHYSSLPNGVLVARNIPMSGAVTGQDTVGLRSGRRMLNKPFMGTESGHGYPNTFGGEGIPIVAAYAAVQGWQGLCYFAYEDHNREEFLTYVSNGQPVSGTGLPSGGRFDSGFEGVWTMGRSPTKMASMPAGVQALNTVTAAPAASAAWVVADKRSMIELIRQRQRVNIGATDFGGGAISSMLAFTTRLGMRMDASDCYVVRPSVQPTSGALADPSGRLLWNTTTPTARFVMSAAVVKAFSGYFVPGTPIALGDNVSVTLNETMQHLTNVGTVSPECWGAIALVLKEGAAFGAAGSRWLVTTAGYTDNFKSTWQTYRGPLAGEDSPAPLSAPAAVGQSPTLVERIGGTLTVPVGAGRLAAYSLDGNGDRIAPLAVVYNGGMATVTLPSLTPTLWYEMSVEVPSAGFTLSFPAGSGGYGAIGSTAIGVKDTGLAANVNVRSSDDTVWAKLGPASETANLMVASDTSSPGNAVGTQSLIFSDSDGNLRGGAIDLRGQNLPSTRAWEIEASLKFSSSTTDTADDVNLIVGQSIDHPVVDVALARPAGAGLAFGVQLLTGAGLVTVVPGQIANNTWVKVRVRVTPPGAVDAPAGGKLELWVNDVAQPLSATTLPSTTALPDRLFVFTGAAATGNGWIDEIKVTLP